jgi:hypothetical protein
MGVLAVMERDARHASRFCCEATGIAAGVSLADCGRFASESDLASAAVAELSDAMADLLSSLRLQPESVTRALPMQQAIAALARVGGAA